MYHSKPKTSKHYFGWNIVFVAAFLTMLTVGMRMSIGPFVIPMSEDLGVSRSWFSTVIALGMLFYGIGTPIAGYFVARFGTRFVLVSGAIMVALSLLGTVYALNSFMFTFSYGILLSVGLAFTSPVAFTPLLSQWFIKRRAMALLFLSTGSMAGIAVLTPLFTQLIKWTGWENTMLLYAASFLVFTIAITFTVIHDRVPDNADMTKDEAEKFKELQQLKASKNIPELSFTEILKTKPFWIIFLGVFGCGYSMNLLGAHAVPMLIDHGFSKEVSSFGISLIGLVAVFSTVVLGRIAAVVEHRYLIMMIYFVRGLAFIFLVWVITPSQLYLVAIISGLVWAGNMGISSTILADIYGIKIVGLLYGCAYLGHQIAGTFSSWLGGWAYETYGTHWISFGSAAFFLIVGSAASLLLPKREDYERSIQKA